MKVLFMANIPSPYRVDFFNEFGKYCDLNVAFEGKIATDRNEKWKPEKFKNFKAYFMNGIRVKNDQFMCFEIIKVIKRALIKLLLGDIPLRQQCLQLNICGYIKFHFGLKLMVD